MSNETQKGNAEDDMFEAKKFDKEMEFLRDPKLLYNTNKILGIDIAGEETTRTLVFVLGLSCKTKYKQMIILKGKSSAGKGWVANHAVDQYFPTRKRGRLTRHALDYARDIDPNEILYLQQLFSPEVAGTIMLTSTSDGGYIIEYYAKDENGRPTTDTIPIPAITLLSTTTFLGLPEEFSTRIWEINTDETQKQTKRVLKFEDEAEKRSLQYILGERDESIKGTLKNAITLLPEVDDIILPFELRGYFPTGTVRVRRDFEKFKQLVKLIAYFHILQRTAYKIKGKKVVFALPQDVYYAVELGKETLESTMKGLERRLTEAIPHIELILKNKEEEPYVTVNDLAGVMSISGNYSYKILQALVQKGVLFREKVGRENHYSKSSKFTNVLETAIKTIDYPKLRKGAENFLSGRFKLLLQRLKEQTKAYNPITGEEFDLYNTHP